MHDGNGTAVYIHGGERGACDDLTLYRRSDFGKNIDRFVGFGHWVLCDGAWRYVGAPLLTRFTDRDYLTAAEMAFNYVLSDKRVLAENWYSRMHNLFPILNHFKYRLDKLDVWVRALAALTNIHIKHQSPLRHN